MMWRRIFLTSIGILFSAQAAALCEVTDDAGHRLTLQKPAARIVVLSPDLVENAFAVGAGKQIIAVVKGSDFPVEARGISQVGSYSGIDLERIVALHPDLIIGWKYAFPKQLEALRQLGIPVYVSAPKVLDDIPRLLRNIGCLTGHDEQAKSVAQDFSQQISALGSVKRTPINVFFQIDDRSLLTINHDSWINQVITLCGGKNVFADAVSITPEVSREALVAANPDVIINNSFSDEWKQMWRGWPEIKAVKSQRMYTINPDLIARAGPRLALGAQLVCLYLDAARAS